MIAPAKTRTFTVALIGNPNTGKSTLFSGLVGVHQHVGNYPGVTVEKKTGEMTLGGRRCELIDLPGLYSLAPRSRDEMVVVDLLLGRRKEVAAVDAVVCLVDAGNLKRNLYLVSQVLDLGLPVVLAVNMLDVARRRGIRVDLGRLQQRVGVPVVPIQANRRIGLGELKAALADLASAVRRAHLAACGFAARPATRPAPPPKPPRRSRGVRDGGFVVGGGVGGRSAGIDARAPCPAAWCGGCCWTPAATCSGRCRTRRAASGQAASRRRRPAGGCRLPRAGHRNRRPLRLGPPRARRRGGRAGQLPDDAHRPDRPRADAPPVGHAGLHRGDVGGLSVGLRLGPPGDEMDRVADGCRRQLPFGALGRRSAAESAGRRRARRRGRRASPSCRKSSSFSSFWPCWRIAATWPGPPSSWTG